MQMATVKKQSALARDAQIVSHDTSQNPANTMRNAEADGSGFLFVNVTAKHDRKAQKIIRTHVMRNYLGHTGDEIAKASAATQAVQGEKMRFRLKADRLELWLSNRPREKANGSARRKSKAKGTSQQKAIMSACDEGCQLASFGDHAQERGLSAAGGFEEVPGGAERTYEEAWYPGFHSAVLSTSPLVSFGNEQMDPFDMSPVGPLKRSTEKWIDRCMLCELTPVTSIVANHASQSTVSTSRVTGVRSILGADGSILQ